MKLLWQFVDIYSMKSEQNPSNFPKISIKYKIRSLSRTHVIISKLSSFQWGSLKIISKLWTRKIKG